MMMTEPVSDIIRLMTSSLNHFHRSLRVTSLSASARFFRGSSMIIRFAPRPVIEPPRPHMAINTPSLVLSLSAAWEHLRRRGLGKTRSEERRVGREGVRQWKSGGGGVY